MSTTTFRLLIRDPLYLHTEPIYSVRVTLGYRALGLLQKDEIVWFWIGSHAEYDRLLTKL